MKKFVVTVLVLLAVSASGGEITFRQLETILKQKQVTYASIVKSFELSNTIYAGTEIVNTKSKLNGKFIGPYIVDARVKGSKEDYPLQFVVCTSTIFIDETGKEVDLKKATAVSERFKYYLVREKATAPSQIPHCWD